MWLRHMVSAHFSIKFFQLLEWQGRQNAFIWVRFLVLLHFVVIIMWVSWTTIVIYSKDDESVGVAHKVNLPEKPATIFLDDDGTVLDR